MNKLIFVVSLLFVVMSWAAPDFEANPCPNKNDVFELEKNQIPLLNLVGVDYWLNCASEPNIHLLTNVDHASWGKGKYRLVQSIAKDTPEALMFLDGYRGGIRSTFQEQSSILSFFISAAKTGACAGKGEIGYLNVSVDEARTKILTETVNTGVCVPYQSEKGVAPLNILDYRGRIKDGAPVWPTPLLGMRVVYYVDNFQAGNDDTEVLGVLDIDLVQKTTASLVTLSGPTYLSQGCGEYLMAARLMGKTSRLALVYRSPKVVVVDYSAKGKELSTVEIYNGSDPKGFSTCEGYLPNFDSLRGKDGAFEFFSVDERGSKMLFLNYNEIEKKTVLTELTY